VKIEDAIRKKKHDLLDVKVSAFETDFLEFSVQISELEDAMLIFIDEVFSTITDVRRSLELLMRFSWMKKINRLKSDLNAKISVVFQQYGVELDEVEKLYEKKTRKMLY
jgi:dynein heavy chain